MRDPVVRDLELIVQAEPLDLTFEERLNALGDLVLELAGAKEAHLERLGQVDRVAGGVPALRG